MSEITDFIRDVLDPELAQLRAERDYLARLYGMRRYYEHERQRLRVEAEDTMVVIGRTLRLEQDKARAEGQRIGRRLAALVS